MLSGDYFLQQLFHRQNFQPAPTKNKAFISHSRKHAKTTYLTIPAMMDTEWNSNKFEKLNFQMYQPWCIWKPPNIGIASYWFQQRVLSGIYMKWATIPYRLCIWNVAVVWSMCVGSPQLPSGSWGLHWVHSWLSPGSPLWGYRRSLLQNPSCGSNWKIENRVKIRTTSLACSVWVFQNSRQISERTVTNWFQFITKTIWCWLSVVLLSVF